MSVCSMNRWLDGGYAKIEIDRVHSYGKYQLFIHSWSVDIEFVLIIFSFF